MIETPLVVLSKDCRTCFIDYETLNDKKKLKTALITFSAAAFGVEYILSSLTLNHPKNQIHEKTFEKGTTLLLKSEHSIFAIKVKFSYVPFLVINRGKPIDEFFFRVLDFFNLTRISFYHAVNNNLTSCFVVLDKSTLQDNLYIEPVNVHEALNMASNYK